MAKSTYMPIKKQEELVRAFIKTYSKYLNRAKLDIYYYRLKGREYLENGVEPIMDNDGFYLFSSTVDKKGRFRISLWMETSSSCDMNFYPITELRWKRFVEQFEVRNNVKHRKYK